MRTEALEWPSSRHTFPTDPGNSESRARTGRAQGIATEEASCQDCNLWLVKAVLPSAKGPLYAWLHRDIPYGSGITGQGSISAVQDGEASLDANGASLIRSAMIFLSRPPSSGIYCSRPHP